MLTPRFGPLSLDSDVVQLLQLLPPENQNTRGSRPRLYFYHDYSLWRLGHVVAVSRTSIWSGIWAVCEQVEHLITKPLAFPKQSREMPWPCTDGLASRSTVAMYALSQSTSRTNQAKAAFGPCLDKGFGHQHFLNMPYPSSNLICLKVSFD